MTLKLFGTIDVGGWENLSTDPSTNLFAGRVYFNTSTNKLKFYDGTQWLTSADTSASLTNPMTTTGDVIYGGSSGSATRLAGNTSATKKFLSQTGTGSASTAPAWSDLPAASDTAAGLIDYYKTSTSTSGTVAVNSGSGTLSSTSSTVKVTRVGNSVTLSYSISFTTSSGSSINSVTIANAVPSWATPTATTTWASDFSSGAFVQFGSVDTSGGIFVYLRAPSTMASTAFAASTAYTVRGSMGWSL